MNYPHLVILLSGKRKCGKDFIAEKLTNRIGEERCCIVRISHPIKSHWAKQNNLDLQQLLSSDHYKEKYRKSMIDWSDELRRHDPGYFCKAACAEAPVKQIWIVSDVRRKTDVQWFKSFYGEKVKTVRIEAVEEERKRRGWIFAEGVDDSVSECGLDDYGEWDLIVGNNDEEELNLAVQKVLELINNALE